MNNILKFEKKKKNKLSKYVIFSLSFFTAIFALMFSSVKVTMAAPSVDTVHESNYEGDNTKTNPNAAVKHTDGRYFVQGTGYTDASGNNMTDVVTFTIKGLGVAGSALDRIAIIETGYSMSDPAPSYDAYQFVGDAWAWDDAITTAGKKGGINESSVCSSFTTAAADSTLLHANDSNGTFDSLFCWNSNGNDSSFNYAYTIRGGGYGLKTINVFIYNTISGVSTEVSHLVIDVIVSKPVNEFETSGFTWVDGTTTCPTDHKTATNYPATSDICAEYTNGTLSTGTNSLYVSIPKEVAYNHSGNFDPDTATVENIPNNSIYAINTFKNSGSSNEVRYYYYNFDFKLESVAYGGSTVNNFKNDTMNPGYRYYLEIVIDASGSYTFYITDFFGNKFASTALGASGDVEVNDLKNSNILIDFTNADLLTIMDATIALENDTTFKGEVVKLTYKKYDGKYKVMYVNMHKDQATIVLELFEKVLITEGLSVCGDSTCPSGVEEIQKQAMDVASSSTENGKIKTVKYWKVAGNDLENKAVPGSGVTTVSYETAASYKQGNSYVNRTYNASGYNNRLEITVEKNGRYRFYAEDTNNNNTDKSSLGVFQNPYVDVTVIDRIAPTLSSGLGSGSVLSTDVKTYEYVNGGGKEVVSDINLTGTPSAATVSSIYYVSDGTTVFNYIDAINIAKMSAKDATTIEGYYTYFTQTAYTYDGVSYQNGSYIDPSKDLLSDRNLTSTTDAYKSTTHLHEYILKNNIDSFTAGMAIPESRADLTGNASTTVTNNKFTLNGVEYTIVYTNDRPTSINPGNVTITNGRTFMLNGAKIISGNRILSYVPDEPNSAVKAPIATFGYKIGETATSAYDSYVNTVENKTDYTMMASFGVAYSARYMGMIEIEFFDGIGVNFASATPICKLVEGQTAAQMSACMGEMNKRIDTVRDFTMRFRVHDYVGHSSEYKAVEVNIKDDTAPGFTSASDFKAQGESNTWTNNFSGSSCMLEIGNHIRTKETLINCYLIGANAKLNSGTAQGTYHFIDNDTRYTEQDLDQWYNNVSGYVNWYDSIKIEIETDTEGTFATVTDTEASNTVLNKAREHDIKFTITDNWNKVGSGTNNSITVILTFYVNPRTILIEPIANEKVYGDVGTDTTNAGANYDPTFDYCVYINTNINTFDKKSEFFDWDFVGENFKLAYCTSDDIFNARKSAGATLAAATTNALSNVLVNGNAFTGNLSRVESLWYNQNVGTDGIDSSGTDSDVVSVQNNYAGHYNMVLGSLAIHPDTASSGAACAASTSDSYTCDQDYVIKIHTHFLVGAWDSTDKVVKGTTDLGNAQTQVKTFGANDATHTESKVLFTIKQNILTVSATGGNKIYGEQDDNSGNYNNLTTVTNVGYFTGYLNGYTTSGYKYNDADSNNYVNGVLRREIGESTGIYRICNIANKDETTKGTSRANPSVDIGCSYGFTADATNPTATYVTDSYKIAAWGIYGDGGEYSSSSTYTPALMIQTNTTVHGTVTGKKVNAGNRNYVIHYNYSTYTINANELVVQPGINQGKEYAETEYVDPTWQIVVYGETVTCSSVTSCTSNMTIDANGFTGWTEAGSTYSYTAESKYSGDTDIYFSRRKRTPNLTYSYVVQVPLTYTGNNSNIYEKSGDVYSVVESSSSGAIGKYVYAYGTYHAITKIVDGTKAEITVAGHLVNQTYTLFVGASGAGSAKLTRTAGGAVGWYQFTAINNNTTTFALAQNTAKAHCTIADASITVSSTGTANCKNYNLKFEDSAPDSHKKADGTTDAATEEEVANVITIQNTTNEYKPNGIKGCYTDGSTAYTSICADTLKTRVLFEIFKREIIISFDASNYIFVYGQRYDYYDGGNKTVNSVDVTSEANKLNGVFKIKDSTSEGDIFVCYSEHYAAVDCTGNADYGITAGDTWTKIGLEFYMHPLISKTDSIFYDTGSDYAIPAGTYYVYANITDAAKLNYKFTYLGGTLTIVPKVTSIQLTSYSMEYKDGGNTRANDKYHSYGLGTDYSNFTEYPSKCMLDSDYLAGTTTLIETSGCLNANNVVGNSYGFVIEGLDSKDTIKQNFIGRATRETGNDVGYYKIYTSNGGSNADARLNHTIQTVKYKPDSLVNKTTYTGTGYTCASFSSAAGFYTDCVYVTGSENYNYDITYSLENNEGAYLFITPARIEIEVEPGQTKMYGCAYSSFNNSTIHAYTIAGGYQNCDQSSTASDIQYKYKVIGDKDYNSGSAYDVTGDLASGNTTSSLEGSLYRVRYTTDKIKYDSNSDALRDIQSDSANNIYQDQSIGTYIITIGDLNAKANGKTMCDAFNNPVLDGGSACRNYNLNYYGHSASEGSASITINDTHKYAEGSAVNLSTLETYDLNYVADEAGQYVLMNGKYILASQVATYTNYYVAISSLPKYSMYKDYVEDTNGTYILINGKKAYKNETTEEVVNGYILLNSLQKYDASGAANGSGTYVKIDSKLVAMNTIKKYVAKSAAEKPYADNANGKYVLINNTYVALDSLKKYNETSTGSGVFTEASNGTHVLIYKESSSSGLTKYKLDPANMYKAVEGGAYVFINGSYVLKSTVAPNATTSTTITINSGVKDGEVALSYYGDSNTSTATTTDDVDANGISKEIQFEITRRDVHIHTEYNVKYIGSADAVETITCAQIESAYGLSDGVVETRYYCDTEAGVDLGTARYYAIDNSLAKYPWTSWVDKANASASTAAAIKTTAAVTNPNDYQDTQFDVVTGKISRASGDVVGKYTYDYADIKPVAYASGSGSNYKIVIETSVSFDETYIKPDGTTLTKLNTLTRYSDAGGNTVDNINGYYIKIGGNVKSISSVEKYRSNNSLIDYWYIGFYQEDDAEGRSGELKKWWTSTSIFSNNYAKLIQGKDNSDNALSVDSYLGIRDPDLSEKREVYFEIVRKVIYLYAVDTSKVYGIADSYDNFKVAICATDNGYTVDGSGNIKCNDPADYNAETNGLTADHRAMFYNNDGTMKQGDIKGGSGFVFIGTTGMKIYFKRSAGENVGSYSVTACALQSDITDCTDPAQEEKPGTQTTHIGDNYKIIERAGTLTIDTRKITIDPDGADDTEVGVDQGFMYGNYTKDGQIPAITYKEYFGYTDESSQGVQGLVNSGNSPTASSKASCFVDVSGDHVVCINDNQNDLRHNGANDASITFDVANREYINKSSYSAADQTKITGATHYFNSNNVYSDSYSDPDNVNSRAEANTRYALNRKCGTTEDLRNSRDVCNYEIVAGELSVNSTWVATSVDEYVTIVKSNVYTANGGTTLFTGSDINGQWLKVGNKYHQIVAGNRYTYSYVQNNEGSYIKIGSSYYKIIDANRYEAGCSVRSNSGDYFKTTGVDCTRIESSNRYHLSKASLNQSNTGEFLKITTTGYNYTVEKFVSGENYVVSEAEVKMTPISNQFKIYGEADPEIKFTVETTYTVKSSHSIDTANVKSINGSAPSAGTTVTVSAGDVVILNGFAYDENMDVSQLDYGTNYTGVKHSDTESSLTQATTGAVHFDVHTAYKANVATSRILIGNFYVNDHDQSVGVKDIINGFVIANNNLGNKNYTLNAANELSAVISGIQFTIIPRPIYVKIADVTKTYGQATDSESCDDASGCTVADGILQDYAEGKLIYNYDVVSNSNKSIPTTPSGGIADVYSSTAINISTVTSSARTGYADLTTFTASQYYTVDKAIEVKNEDLQIKVERGSYNVTRSSATCFVTTETYVSSATGTNSKGCEDVGKYYTKFVGDNESTALESSVEAYYHGDYWGYNKNYYVLIENTTDTAADNALNANNKKETQKYGAELTINKKSITIIIETFTDVNNRKNGNLYGVNELGEIYNIEENMDVPALPTVSNSNAHTTFGSITWEEHPSQVRTADQLFGYAAYCQTRVQSIVPSAEAATAYEAVQKSTCTSTALVYHNNGTDSGLNSVNNANSGPVVFSTKESGFYAIVRDPKILYIRYSDGNSMASAENDAYESNNYTTTFINGVLAIDDDETAPVIYAGTEYYAIEANNGTLQDINKFTEDGTYDFLNNLKVNKCQDITGIKDSSGNLATNTNCVVGVFTTAIPVNSNKFKLDGYEFTIDGTIIRSNHPTQSAITISGDAFSYNSNTYHILKNAGGTPIFIVVDATTDDGVTKQEFTDILSWFNINSHDPGILRNGAPVPKRYDARYYIAIDSNFNQRVVGSYTLYIYALDVAGNISRATTVTLNVQDNTKPETGYLNLYEGKISCDFTTKDCVSFGADFGTSHHSVWSNNADGIYLSVTGGRDNTLTYLNLSGRTRYAKDSTTITISNGGSYILNGTIVKLHNLTQYVKQDGYYFVKDPNNQTATNNDIYIRVNGQYKLLKDMTIYTLDGSTYTQASSYEYNGEYYVVVGDWVDISSNIKYNITNDGVITRNDSTGTYIKLSQWDHYFSRDNGATWIKYDLETFNADNKNLNGYSALQTDGQRLILIKAVDNGYVYAGTDAATNTVNGTAKTYFSATYYDKAEQKWYSPSTYVVTGTFTEYKTGTTTYHVSDWADSVEVYANDSSNKFYNKELLGNYHNGYYRDRRYAYLDTQQPLLTLTDNGLWVFEYGCANCTNGYSEKYGNTVDYYLLDISTLKVLNDANGDYINIAQENQFGVDLADRKVYLAGRRYAKGSEAQTACSAKWINGACYTASASGSYVYVGLHHQDVALTVDTTITPQVFATLTSGLGLKYNTGTAIGDATITFHATGTTDEQIVKNTIYTVSGLSGSNIMNGSQNTTKSFTELDYAHKRVTVYLTVSNPNSTTSGVDLTNSALFGSQNNRGTTYYKYNIVCSDASSKCTVTGYYSTSDNTVPETSSFSVASDVAGDGTKDAMELAIYKVIARTLTASTDHYKGKDLTYSINYRTTDMAGNVSTTQVRGIIFSSFLEAVTMTVQSAGAVALYNSYAIDVTQNTSALSVLGNFKVSTSKSASRPTLDNYLVQTVYYNDKLISENETYDPNTLGELDTTVPGVYKLVYSTKRLDGDRIVYGTPFELTINVKPNVANVNATNIDYKQIVVTAFIVSSIIAMVGCVIFVSKKKKFN